MIEKSFQLLDQYVQKEGYKGWDLFDGLNSLSFKKSPFYAYEISRLIWIQFFKRSPINFRKIARVPKEYNAKGLGLFASGLIYAGKIDKARSLLDQLQKMVCPGYSGDCWGYNFDWQARAFYVPVGKPNIVTTVFVANAFLDYFDKTEDDSVLACGIHAGDFILNHLILYEDREKLCFAYIPGERTRVHNANMLGASLLGRLYSYTNNSQYLEKSRKSMTYSMSALKPDFSWPYGELHHHQFVDNFHTGFNLVALKEWMAFTSDWQWEEELKSAYDYFLDTFWKDDGCPKYYNNSLYPIDIHCSAQGIATCLKLDKYNTNSFSKAQKIAEWAINNMQDQQGYFYYQELRFYKNKVSYIRWAQAWMYYALALYMFRQSPQGS